MHKILDAPAREDFQTVPPFNTRSKTPHKSSVLLENQKGVPWMIRDQIQESVRPLRHRMAVYDGRGLRIRLAPVKIHTVSIRPMPEYLTMAG
jgi:hypothetical protein